MKLSTVFFLVLIFIPILTFAAKAPVQKTPAPAAQTQPAPPDDRYCIFGAQSGKPFNTEAAFKALIWKSDVIYLGGAKGGLNGPPAALEVLTALKIARGPKIAVGFETLDITLQPVLDDYLSGKITENDFVSAAAAQKERGFDFGLNKPVFDLMIRNKLRALALGVPQKLVSEIAALGLAGLNEEDKKTLPEQINISRNKKYLDRLRTSFNSRGEAASPNTLSWDNYLASIAAANEAAGAVIADFVKANPGWSVAASVDNDRIIYNAAIPASVKNRIPKIRQASFYITAPAKCPSSFPKEHQNIANYVWYMTTVVSGQ